nr:CbiX/SirB N-terminal domain-containing protein [Corynebacterium lactis]
MTALILLAHGSRHPETGAALDSVVKQVREALPSPSCGGPSQVRLAWLDLDEPSLDDVCADLAAAGERSAVAVPLLFTDAFHSRIDVPAQVGRCDRHGVAIEVSQGLGLGDGTRRAIVRRIVEAAREASFSGPVDALIMAVGSSDATANRAVHDFAEGLDGMFPGKVSAAFAVGPEQVKGAAAVQAAQARAAMRGRDLVVVPLFTAPGLLWDKVTAAATADAGDRAGVSAEDDAGAFAGISAGGGRVSYGRPLGDLLVPIVCCRWDSVAGYGRPGAGTAA